MCAFTHMCVHMHAHMCAIMSVQLKLYDHWTIVFNPIAAHYTPFIPTEHPFIAIDNHCVDELRSLSHYIYTHTHIHICMYA